MDTIFESRSEINNHLQRIFSTISDFSKDELEKRNALECKIKELTSLIQRMNTEIADKDKLLSLNEKKMYDYEIMINKIQEQALQEQDEKEKFSIMRSQDKEINEKNKKIDLLEKKVQSLEENLKLQNESCKIQETIIDTNTSEIPDQSEESDEIKKDKINTQDSEVLSAGKEDVEEGGVDTGKEDAEDEEEGVDVKTITYRKKEYYIIVGETPQYIYTIDDDGDIGEKVGEMVKNKKTFYAIDSKK